MLYWVDLVFFLQKSTFVFHYWVDSNKWGQLNFHLSRLKWHLSRLTNHPEKFSFCKNYFPCRVDSNFIWFRLAVYPLKLYSTKLKLFRHRPKLFQYGLKLYFFKRLLSSCPYLYMIFIGFSIYFDLKKFMFRIDSGYSWIFMPIQFISNITCSNILLLIEINSLN